jgi:serine/threonine-protein kinase
MHSPLSRDPTRARAESRTSPDSRQLPSSHRIALELPVLPGQIVGGKYRVIQRIGAGGMGQVFSAMHLELRERVALKFLRREALAHPELVQRFAVEARAAARIRSEHVARVFDVGTLEDGVPFIVMEFLDGEDLSDVLAERGSLPSELAVDYVLEVCEALASAHAKGIIHRDIKPENLFLARTGSALGTIKVLDFGVSKLSLESAAGSGERHFVRTTLPVGSPAYMSPEQIRDCGEVDPRTDIWSLGCALFELLTGKVPFDAPTLVQLGAAILEQEPTPLRRELPNAAPELEAVVSRCLNKDANARFASVTELARALAPFASERARIHVERCGLLLPAAESLRDCERLLHRDSIPSLTRDPTPTLPALGRGMFARAGRGGLRAGLWVFASVAALALSYVVGRQTRADAIEDVAPAAAAARAQGAELARPLPLTPAREGQTSRPARAPLEPALGEPGRIEARPPAAASARARVRVREQKTQRRVFGRARDEAFDVGY